MPKKCSSAIDHRMKKTEVPVRSPVPQADADLWMCCFRLGEHAALARERRVICACAYVPADVCSYNVVNDQIRAAACCVRSESGHRASKDSAYNDFIGEF